MFANPDFSFPGRKNVPTSNTPDTLSRQNNQQQHGSSMHGRQFSLSSTFSNDTTPQSPVRSSRPVSGHHHRRQSSVSSRRESREIMGIDHNDDHYQLTGSGIDQRQRALWALEGKRASCASPVMLGFSKVELPDWNTPEVEKDGFNWPSPRSSASSLSGSSSSRHSHTPVTSVSAGVGGAASSVPNPFSSSSSFSLNNALANKRDSFGKSLLPPSSSLKKELQTLMEEDEDMEEDDEDFVDAPEDSKDGLEHERASDMISAHQDNEQGDNESEEDSDCELDQTTIQDQIDVPAAATARPPSVPTVIPASPAATVSPTRPRPPVLTLRPLSLVSALPTTISPSPRLKSLTLATKRQNNSNSNNIINSNASTHEITNNNNSLGRRQSLLSTTPTAPLTPSPSPNATSSNTSTERQLRRQSSIGYRRETDSSSSSSTSLGGTPSRRSNRMSMPITPGLTPTSAASAIASRSVSPSTPSDSFSSSRASSEFFHTQAMSSLLSRIASLEEALQTAQTSPTSSQKHESLPLAPESAHRVDGDTDDLISVITDLKAERDELNADVAGWRTRCTDLERSCDIFGKKLAEERKELWAARDRAGVLESETQALRAARTKLEAAIVEEKMAMEGERKARVVLEESVNAERAEWAKESMKLDTDRLKWAKEKRGWEAERELFRKEVEQFEQALVRREDQVDRLEKKIAELERLRTTPTLGDLTVTPKAKNAWNGQAGKGGFAFPPLPTPADESDHVLDFPPPPSSPSIAESPVNVSSSSSRPLPARNMGTLNTGFKFGGGVPPQPQQPKSAFSPVDSPVVTVQPPHTNASSPTESGFALGVVDEVDEDEEEEEDCLEGYEDEEEGDADASMDCHDSDEDEDDEDRTQTQTRITVPILVPPLRPLSTLPAPLTAAPPPAQIEQAPKHAHRRSASQIAKWRFPSMPRRAAPTPSKPVAVDRFFACLEAEDARPISLVGREMKPKEHKKLPSGCPAFWLDCDEDDKTHSTPTRATALPTPAISEEEDNVESEAESGGTRALSTPFVLIPRSSAAVFQPIRVTTPSNSPVTVPAATRVSLTSRKPSGPIIPPYIPPQALPASSPARAVVRTVPPAASPTMAVPPSLRVQAIASPQSAQSSLPCISSRSTSPSDFTRPSLSSPSSSSLVPPSPPPSSFAARFSLSSIIPWSSSPKPSTRVAASPLCPLNDEEDGSSGTLTTNHTPTASLSSPSLAKASANKSIRGSKHVDPAVMRERLKAQLERDGRSRHSFLGPNQTEPCGKCSATGVVEL